MSNKEKAQKGLSLLEDAFLEEISHMGGQRPTEIANKLGLFTNRHVDKHYFQWSICRRLENQGKIQQGEDFIPSKTPLDGWWIVK